MTAAVVLAAGASRRMGQPKQLAHLAGETMLSRTVRLCGEAGLEPVIVVLGAAAETVARSVVLQDVVVVVNEGWEEGMASSIRIGVESLPHECTGAVVVTCDMPAVTAPHLRGLAACDEVTASGYAGRKGVPAYFPASSFPALLQLKGDAGARNLLAGARAIQLHGGDLDIDTLEDLQRAREIFS